LIANTNKVAHHDGEANLDEVNVEEISLFKDQSYFEKYLAKVLK